MAESLPDRMRFLASTSQDSEKYLLLEHAYALDEAIEGFYGDPQTVPVAKFVRTWARARKVWCDITGEPLL